ncbi:MAG TPA: winged helix-turn-helix domain-containing protein [Terriglobales bacterium]|jgi:DNA-binding winged helix-turn-helix (wHTH) protein/TolB-like protein|nr:winged helix-turn-helix domain-containing protein [Terriglobales bacterium]
MTAERFRFGIFEFNRSARELRRDGVLVRLQSQPAQVLVCLLERAGEVVSREELRQAVWREDTFVDFERGLNFCIAQIRAALKDNPPEPRFIRTIPKRGYQFVAPVTPTSNSDLLPTHLGNPDARSRVRTVASVLALCLLLASLFAAGYWVKSRSLVEKTPIVAVLRFDNETGDPDMTRLSDAVTDMLVAELTAKGDGQYRVIGNARELRVAREHRDLNAVASSLGASYVILGQVQRSGDQTRILAHLIHLPEQTHVWVTRIDRTLDNPLTLESQVAQTVASQFSPKIRTTFVPFASRPRASL